MAAWSPFPHPGAYRFDATNLTRLWPRLHAGDAEPLPDDPAVLAAWVRFHNGEFEQAAAEGQRAGGAGLSVAHKATCIHATYLEPSEKARLALFLEVARRAEDRAAAEPGTPAAWFWHAYALGRYSQGISVGKALAQGLGARVKAALERTIALAPRHADAHVALGAFHAEVIDKVGPMVGGMTYGARKDTGLALFREALRIHPDSAIGRIEYANGLVMLEGEAAADEANRLYEQVASCEPMDATERLEVALARTELHA